MATGEGGSTPVFVEIGKTEMDDFLVKLGNSSPVLVFDNSDTPGACPSGYWSPDLVRVYMGQIASRPRYIVRLDENTPPDGVLILTYSKGADGIGRSAQLFRTDPIPGRITKVLAITGLIEDDGSESVTMPSMQVSQESASNPVETSLVEANLVLDVAPKGDLSDDCVRMLVEYLPDDEVVS